MDIIRKFSIRSKNNDPEEEIVKLHHKLSTNTRRMSDVSRKYQRAQQKQEELERKLVAAKQKKAEDDAFYARQAKAIERPEGECRVWWQTPATSFSEIAGIIPDRGEEGEVIVRRTPTSGSDNPLLSASRSRSNSRSRRLPSTRSNRSLMTEAAEGAARAVKSAMTDGYSSNKRGRPPAAGARYGHLFDTTTTSDERRFRALPAMRPLMQVGYSLQTQYVEGETQALENNTHNAKHRHLESLVACKELAKNGVEKTQLWRKGVSNVFLRKNLRERKLGKSVLNELLQSEK